ncbi:MAG: S-layer homology domain-containing protein [Peptococcia bacterium]
MAEKKFTGVIILMTLLVLFACGAGIISFAADGAIPPTVAIDINAASHFEANLDFVDLDNPSRNTPWCPGLAKVGSVRIMNNNFDVVTIRNIAVEIANINDHYEAFVNNMHLRITDVLTGKTVYDNILAGIAHPAGNSGTGINLDQTLNRGGQTELEFILSMNPEAGDEMQGLTAYLAFQLNTEDTTQYPDPPPYTPPYPLPSQPPEPAFLLAGDNWYDDCILALIANGIIIPDIDGELRPDEYITRAEVAVHLGRALGLEEDFGPTGYLDEIPEQYRGWVTATSKAGVYKGYPLITERLPGRVFKANKFITREEFCCVLVRAYQLKLDGDLELSFSDSEEISAWALADIKAGVQGDIIGGYPDNTLKPQQFTSRAEAFVLICRLQDYHDAHSLAAGGAGE